MTLDSLLHWGGVLDELDLAQRLHSWRGRGLADLADARRPCPNLPVMRAIDTPGFTEAPHAAARRAAGLPGSVNNNLSPARTPPDPADADQACLTMALICGQWPGSTLVVFRCSAPKYFQGRGSTLEIHFCYAHCFSSRLGVVRPIWLCGLKEAR